MRQSEAPDYIMRPNDPINSGGMNSATRPLARKFSPYNLTDPGKTPESVDKGTRGYGFTEYPSQAGYVFKWGGTTAWYPTGSVPGFTNYEYNSTYWDDNPSWETCPPGYHRPSDGITSGNTSTSISPSVSEFRQSLWISPTAGTESQNVSNSMLGYYADGFFDRREIMVSISGVAASTAGSNADIAFTGKLFFFPTTSASIFFPNVGARNLINGGPIALAGLVGYYWTTGLSVKDCSSLYSTNLATSFLQVTTGYGMPIRCVAD